MRVSVERGVQLMVERRVRVRVERGVAPMVEKRMPPKVARGVPPSADQMMPSSMFLFLTVTLVICGLNEFRKTRPSRPTMRLNGIKKA